ncbi:MAG: 3-deoxy-8-phosphooctulonate synthase [Desulfobacterota bacterium]|nr:3-deoxy-8-phosphooctulonate synthase [Thermodesulfobacteriota bacterium]MDW8001935.1 3-deoxy-8-phosphooctulonate synthase [Deltaproteobacteria bacterium]
MEKKVRVWNVEVGSRPFVFIGGPCVIEGEYITLKTAEELKKITEELSIPFIFKSSYDKANRTSISSFRGPGLKEGLRILKKVREEVGVPVLTDVHSVQEIEEVKEVVDVLQVPALLSRQTDLLLACGRSKKPVNIKKGQFMSPYDVKYAIEKVEKTGCESIMVTERGTCFGYRNLICDFRSIPIMKDFGYPVIFDATHSVQTPGGMGDKSGGDRRFAFPLARCAIACGADGIFMEVHPDPDRALCDAENSVALKDLKEILEVLKDIEEAVWTKKR